MPALRAILTADASQFDREMLRTGAISVSAAKSMEKAWAAQAIYLEAQIVAAKKSGAAYAVYEAELATINTQLAIMRTETAGLVVAENAAAGAATKNVLANANWKGAIGELIVIFREIGRGNWSRVPGSISILAQRMGVLRYVLNPLGAVLIASGAAAFFFWRHLKTVNEQLGRTQELFDKGFGNMAKAMQDANREASRAAADFDDWLKQLSQSHRSLADDVNDAVMALREEARLKQELAASKGASRADLAKMDLESKRKELAIVNAAVAKQQAILFGGLQTSILSNGQAFTSDDAKARNARLANIPKTRADLEEEIKRLEEVRLLRQDVKGKVIGPGLSVPVSSNEVVAVGEKGKEVRVSLDQVNGQLQKERAALKALNEEEDRLTSVQRSLADAARDAKEKTEKDTSALETLTKERDRLRSDIELHSKFDPQIANSLGNRLIRGSVNSLQQVGAYTSPAQTVLIDVNRKIHAEIQGLRKDVQHLSLSNFGRGEY